MRSLPAGCSFALRCRFATAACHETIPSAATVAPGHNVACLRVAEISPSAKLAVS
jgi:oligopeptide/dipeptide ABC transporter ATP-binding protein